jgi:peptide/nickel transport system permease protein
MERKNIFREFLVKAKRDPSLLFAMLIISLFLIFAAIPQILAPEGYITARLDRRLLPPSAKHPLGTDFVGRDILSLIIWGSRVALLVTTIPTFISTLIGVSIGILSGYKGGTVDDIVMRFVDILMSFPGLLLALAIITVLGPGLWNAMWSVTIGRISGYVRLSRSLTFAVKETGYVEYAKAVGTTRSRIMTRHIFPNILTPIIVQMTFSMPGTLLSVAGLSFLGLGPSPPTPDWGVLMQQSRAYLVYAPWAAIVPGLAIFLIAFSFNTIGETLRDIIDPRRKYIKI